MNNFKEYQTKEKEKKKILIRKCCDNLLSRGIVISPKNIYEEELKVSKTDEEKKLIIKPRTLSRSDRSWRSIIDIYKLAQEKENISISKKNLSELELKHQNFVLREKLIKFDIENKILREANTYKEKIIESYSDTKNKKYDDFEISNIEVFDWKKLLVDTIISLRMNTHFTEIIEGNLYVFGKDGKVLLLTNEILIDLKLDT